jgi:hypothetical protein
MTTKGKGEHTSCQFYCSCCKKGCGILLYNKREYYYPVALCCNSLICKECYQNRTAESFECKICAKQTNIGVRNKLGYRTPIGWMNCFDNYDRFYSSIRGQFPYIIPLFTKTRIFTDCEELGVVLSDMSSPFQKKYHEIVDNFYSRVFLFYSLRSAAIMRLDFPGFKTSPGELDFFKLMRDMTFFSNHSRKKILRWGLNGFNYFIIDKLSQGDKYLLCVKKKKFLVMLLRIVLAKNPKL